MNNELKPNSVGANVKPPDWIDLGASPEQIRRERARGRQLRTSAWWKAKLQAGVCYYCGKKFRPSELTMDHIIPVARGGKSERTNVVTACRACNQGKGHLTRADIALSGLEAADSAHQIIALAGGGRIFHADGVAIAEDPTDAFALLEAVADLQAVLVAVLITENYREAATLCRNIRLGRGVRIIAPQTCVGLEPDQIAVDSELLRTPVKTFRVKIVADGKAIYS